MSEEEQQEKAKGGIANTSLILPPFYFLRGCIQLLVSPYFHSRSMFVVEIRLTSNEGESLINPITQG